ncbi:MAG: phosphatidate phosphatase App1 family protein [Pirellulaceae bacterium]
MQLLLFPTFAAPDPKREDVWRVPASGVCLKSKTKRIKRQVLLNVLRRLTDVPPEQLETQLCQERMAPFILAPSSKRKIRFEVDQREVGTVKKTKRNGHFRTKILLGHEELARGIADSGQLQLLARPSGSELSTEVQIRLLPARGHSIISDIDDTIKFSDVENRSELLANTFVREYQPIAGMPQVYRQLAAEHCEFHYVSASPWQLYHPLQDFMQHSGYPSGSMILRKFRLSDHLLKRLGVIHRGGKSAAIRRILSSFPHRRFTLIGDSGERDAEIYARCYQLYPDRVQQILIRLIRPEHRYREPVIEAEHMLPPGVFQVFETADQLGTLLERARSG